jgi:hypothetical protein
MTVPHTGPFQLKVSARGALIRAFFGSAIMYWGVVFSGHATPLWFSIVTLVTVALLVWAILLVRATRGLPSSAAELDHWKTVRTFYWLDFGLEWVLIGFAMLVLSRFGRFDLVPQAIGVIVGLHYLPLGKILRAQQYYWTGGVMMAGSIGSLLIDRGPIRTIVGCAAVGLTLWISCAAILYWSFSAVRRLASSNIPSA